jgi:Skp family chaperone for outer membrane proteins
MQRLVNVLLILAFFSGVSAARAEEFSEEERLLGFAQQQRRNAEMDRERQSGADDVKRNRAEWEENLQKSVQEYRDWKSRQAAALDERSPEYKADVALKKSQDREHDEARERYVRERDRRRAQRKITVRLTEEHEYGLDEPIERVPIDKRKLYGSNTSSGRGGRFSPGGRAGGGSTDFGVPAPPPPPDFNPPTSAPPPAPEFYEPEIPPPPPPAEFDENIPPPIFEDNEF